MSQKIMPEYKQQILLEKAKSKTLIHERKTINARLKASRRPKRKSRPIKLGRRRWF